MSRAIQLARRGRYSCDPNPQVGCVVSRENQIISEGWHAVAGQAHAEINALNNCDDVSGATVYVTLEPCSHQGRTPPCVEALINAKVTDVIIAMVDPNPLVAGSGIKTLENAGINVKQGLLEAEARKLNPGFIKRMTKHLPYTRCKMAMSLDGRTALANGESQWISSKLSRRDVHRLRAASSAVLTSVETLIKDDAVLNARDLDFDFKPAVRVVVDRALKIPEQAKIFSIPDQIIIYTESDNDARINEIKQIGVEVVRLPRSESWLKDVFIHLANEFEINELLIEAGATFSGALIEQELVDELVVYMAPVLLGNDANPLVRLKQLEKLNDAIRLEIVDVRKVGKDMRFTLTL
ncbi:MAG: riboflavin biosynthesis protein RibD [marine bacterium B5-7]|nr:MAG: riboflavin biosynthesis protein RibD [marine bacterium B5-7]